MLRRDILRSGLAAGVTLASAPFSGSECFGGECFGEDQAVPLKLLPADYAKLPLWKGFNLLEKFNGRNDRFREDDFRWISDFGFNFARLPLDYRAWIFGGDWRQIDERVLTEIDEAVALGERYGIHVNINFHRAPGYTVASPPEPKSLWTDADALDVCSLHWATFAKRYRGIGNDRVSFNLFNEPAGIGNVLPQCIAAHRAVIAAIRAEDDSRLIICDGNEWGAKPFEDLATDRVAQATRGYAPSEISHYKASWVNSKDFPEPSWPQVAGNGLLVSPHKNGIADESKRPLVITGMFSSPTRLRLRVGTVSSETPLTVIADGSTLWEHRFKPGPGDGEWKEVVHRPAWNVYQNRYDRDYEVVITAGTQRVEIRAAGGDWLTLTELGLRSEAASRETRVTMTPSWNSPSTTFTYHEAPHDGRPAMLTGGETKDREWLWRGLEPWRRWQQHGGVMVGEFGAHSPCPHDVALRWMGDMLANWQTLGWGYALWNFRGSFGILDSGRVDVRYEDFHGHKLDRKMLKLLQGT